MLLNSSYWENKGFLLQLTSLMLSEGVPKVHKVSLLQTINRIPLLKYRCRGFCPSNYFPTLDNDTSVIISTQPNSMQGEHWIMTTTSRQILYPANSLGHERYSFFKQQNEQIMPEPLQSHPSVYCFYMIYAVFNLIKSRQKRKYRSSRC